MFEIPEATGSCTYSETSVGDRATISRSMLSSKETASTEEGSSRGELAVPINACPHEDLDEVSIGSIDRLRTTAPIVNKNVPERNQSRVESRHVLPHLKA